MRNGRTQDQAHVEVAIRTVRICGRTGIEMNHDVGKFALRTNEPAGVAFASLELGQHLFRGVTALGGVTFDLPQVAHVLGGVEEMRHLWKIKRDTTKRGYTAEQVL